MVTHNKVVIKTDPSKGFTNYSGWGQFPSANVQYHKLYLDLTFECAPGLKCGEWDYLNFIFLERTGGVNGAVKHWEIGRFITPYGFYWNSGQNWNFTWRFDMSDIAILFHDSVEIVYQHTGYEGNTDRGWRINLAFTAIEGTPVRPITGVKQLYFMSAPYGDDQRFEDAVKDTLYTLGSQTQRYTLRFLQTGHGMDQPSNCAEFCAKKRYVTVDNAQVEERLIWRDDCGANPLFPQAGTWIYDRAGWCPGAIVDPTYVEMENQQGGSSHTMDLDMETYSQSGGSSNYVISAWLLEHSGYSFERDATVEDILQPSKAQIHGRYNPMCGAPVIKVRNNGKQAITQLSFKYGVRGGETKEWTWNGQIPSLGTAEITLERFDQWGSNPKYFDVEIVKVNGSADEYAYNNKAWSEVAGIPVVWPDKILVVYNSNKAAEENSFKVLDANNHVIYQRGRYQNSKLQIDTVQLYNSCFTFYFSDEEQATAGNYLNEDGINWWASSSYDGTGTLQIRNGYSGTVIRSFAGDFGSNIQYRFTVGYPLGQEETAETMQEVKVYPNPAQGMLYVDFGKLGSEGASIVLIGLNGQEVLRKQVSAGESAFQSLDISTLASGVYAWRTSQGVVGKVVIE